MEGFLDEALLSKGIESTSEAEIVLEAPNDSESILSQAQSIRRQSGGS